MERTFLFFFFFFITSRKNFIFQRREFERGIQRRSEIKCQFANYKQRMRNEQKWIANVPSIIDLKANGTHTLNPSLPAVIFLSKSSDFLVNLLSPIHFQSIFRKISLERCLCLHTDCILSPAVFIHPWKWLPRTLLKAIFSPPSIRALTRH